MMSFSAIAALRKLLQIFRANNHKRKVILQGKHETVPAIKNFPPSLFFPFVLMFGLSLPTFSLVSYQVFFPRLLFWVGHWQYRLFCLVPTFLVVPALLGSDTEFLGFCTAWTSVWISVFFFFFRLYFPYFPFVGECQMPLQQLPL